MLPDVALVRVNHIPATQFVDGVTFSGVSQGVLTQFLPDSALGELETAGSGRVVTGAGAAHGLIDDALGHLRQLAVFGLADGPQL